MPFIYLFIYFCMQNPKASIMFSIWKTGLLCNTLLILLTCKKRNIHIYFFFSTTNIFWGKSNVGKSHLLLYWLNAEFIKNKYLEQTNKKHYCIKIWMFRSSIRLKGRNCVFSFNFVYTNSNRIQADGLCLFVNEFLMTSYS